MKTSKTILTLIAAAIACSATAYAEGDQKKGKRPGPDAHRKAIKAKMLKRFDTDKDGKLSEAERKAAREAIAKQRKEIKAAVLTQFDKNENGKIDYDERDGIREWVKENYPNAAIPHRKRGDKQCRGPGGKRKRGGADKPEKENAEANE